jgi:hypothetical protein
MDQNQKSILREQIINETCFYINHFYNGNKDNNKIPLNIFVGELLGRSKTSFFVSQLVNIYLSRIIKSGGGIDIISGRKLYIGALIVTTKYHSDVVYFNKAWVKIIGGIDIEEVNYIERNRKGIFRIDRL